MFCSCSDRGEDISGRRYPILFGSTDTRAVADITDLQDNGFKVYAHFKGSLGSASFEKDVTFNSEKNVWGYEGIQYWIPSTNYWFTAFYPKESSAGTVEVTEQEGNYHSYTITDFDITKQEDIMVAQAYREVGANADAPTEGSVVKLNFQHLLACVVVKIKSETDETVVVKEVAIDQVANAGSYTYGPVPNTDPVTYSGSWTSSMKSNLSYEPSDLSIGTGQTAEITGAGILVIPEEIPSGRKLTIVTEDKEYVAEIPIDEIKSWEKGQRYTYTLTIKNEYIIFSEPTVEEWDEENATGSVIIK